MTGIHIDEFYHDAAVILTRLFQVFPRPVTVFVEDISGEDEPDEFGVHSSRYQACFATLLWLGEEGYIRYQDTIKSEAIDQAVLTGRCFTALLAPVTHPLENQLEDQADLPPSVQAERASCVSTLQGALKSRSSVEVRNAILPLLTRMSG